MAEEETAQEATNEESPKKSKKPLLLILLVVIVVVLGGGGFYAWRFVLGAPTNVNELRKSISGKNTKKPQEPKEKKVTMGPIQALEPFIVNLSGDQGERYLKVAMNIELSNEDVVEEVTKRIPQLRDSIIILLSSKKFNEISQFEGKKELKRALLTRINSFLVKGKAKSVYFTEFVVQ